MLYCMHSKTESGEGRNYEIWTIQSKFVVRTFGYSNSNDIGRRSKAQQIAELPQRKCKVRCFGKECVDKSESNEEIQARELGDRVWRLKGNTSNKTNNMFWWDLAFFSKRNMRRIPSTQLNSTLGYRQGQDYPFWKGWCTMYYNVCAQCAYLYLFKYRISPLIGICS